MSFFPRELAAPASVPRPAIEWEEPNCLLCGSRHWSQLVEAPDQINGGSGLWFAVVQCQDCGLCFTSPRPNIRSIGQFYPACYWPQRAPSPRERKTNRPGLGRRWYRFLQERRVFTPCGGARLLDFGCGGGTFLERMHQHGWHATGLDMSPTVVQKVRVELGLPIHVGSLPHRDLPPSSFDVVTMWHSLEHVHNPREVLQEAYMLLAPGGRLVVAVPNIESLAFHWFAQAWYGLDLPRHLTHFAPRTLQSMLERTGFRVGKVRLVRRSSWLRASARQAHAHGAACETWRHWLRAKPASRLAAWYSFLTGQADCMQVTATRPA
jgi:SAM-dependent methyltransferase